MPRTCAILLCGLSVAVVGLSATVAASAQARSASPGVPPDLAPPAAYPDAKLQALDADGSTLMRALLDGTDSNWVMRDAGIRVTGAAAEPNRRLLARDVLAAYPALASTWRTVVTSSDDSFVVSIDGERQAGSQALRNLAVAAHVQAVVPPRLPAVRIQVHGASAADVADALASVLGLTRIGRPGLWMFSPTPGADRAPEDDASLTVRFARAPVGPAAALLADATGTDPAFACDQRTELESLALDGQPLSTITEAIAIVSGTNGHPERSGVTCLPAPWTGRVEEFINARVLGIVSGGTRDEALVRRADGRLLRVVAGVGPPGVKTTVRGASLGIDDRSFGIEAPTKEWTSGRSFSVLEFFDRLSWRRASNRLSATVVERRSSIALVEDDEFQEACILPGGTSYGENSEKAWPMVALVRDGELETRRGYEASGPRLVLRRTNRHDPDPAPTGPVEYDDSVSADSPEARVASIAGECAERDADLRELRSRFSASSPSVREGTERQQECDALLRAAWVELLESQRQAEEEEFAASEMMAPPSDGSERPTIDGPADAPAGIWFVRTFDEKPEWLPARALADRYAGDSWGDTLAIELDARLRKMDLRSRLLSRRLDPKVVEALLGSDLTWECGGTIDSLQVATKRSATLYVQFRLRRRLGDEMRVVQAGRIAVSSGWHAAPTERDLRELIGKTADRLADELVRAVPVDAFAGRN